MFSKAVALVFAAASIASATPILEKRSSVSGIDGALYELYYLDLINSPQIRSFPLSRHYQLEHCQGQRSTVGVYQGH